MNLPVQQTPFVGRVRELQVAGELLRDHRLVTLIGTGGSGKTRLALQVAATAGERFPDGVFWVPLATVRDPNVFEQTIAQSVGADCELVEYLAEKILLLVLDNMEQVVAAAPMLAALFRACPGLHGLVTSREPLHISAEQRFTVNPLTSDDAVALFVDRARAVDSTFVENASVATICRRLDGLPLAVELAATWVNVLTLDALLMRLEHRLPMLTVGTRDMPERHQTLRATIEWSEDLLSATERRLFHRLAIFPAGFDLSAAEAVCAADLATISSLVNKCLVHRAGDGRFALLETVREFAAEHLTVSERDELAQRHVEYFVRVSEAIAGPQSWPPNPETFGRLDDDLANVRAALIWTQSQANSEQALRLGVALSRYWIDRGHHHDADAWLQTAPLASTSVPVSLRAAALEAAGMLDYFVAADTDQARCYYMESLALRRELGDKQRCAFLLNRLGRIARQRGDIDKALTLHGEALALFEEVADNPGRAATLHLLGETARDQGQSENAEGLLKDAIRLAVTSYPSLLRHSLHSLGDVELDRGDYPGAVAYYRQSLDETGAHERRSRLLCVAGTSSALAGLGEYRAAALLWGAVEAEERSLGLRILSDERNRYERWAATTREQLGEPAFSTACREGEALALDEAFSQAASYLPTSTTRGRHSNQETVDTLSPSVDGSFQHEGEYWTIGYQGRVVRLRDSKGVRVLAYLLADPGRPHAALDLERLGASWGDQTARAVASSDAGMLLDDEARRAYRARLAELRDAMETAQAWGKADEAGVLREEMDFLTHELGRALGLGGRPRRAGSVAERARLNVMRAVRAAMQRISVADAELGAHLEATVHTGTVCVYTPDPRVPITWHVTSGDVRAG